MHVGTQLGNYSNKNIPKKHINAVQGWTAQYALIEQSQLNAREYINWKYSNRIFIKLNLARFWKWTQNHMYSTLLYEQHYSYSIATL